MRIAVVNSFVAEAGANGEDFAVHDQVDLLRAAGHEVLLVSRATDRLRPSRTHLPLAAATVATGHGPTPLPEIRRFTPDVVHVHNTYPNFGRSWAAELDIPVVLTLHSFRLWCAKATFFRSGRVCTDCVGAPLSAVRNGCYDGPLRSLPYAVAGLRRSSDPLIGAADRIIVLNPRARDLLAEDGYDPARVVDGINTAPALPGPGPGQPADAGLRIGEALGPGAGPAGASGWLFVGRLTEDKGVVELVRWWPGTEPLDIIGDGPSAAAARQAAGPQVRFHGQLDRSAARTAMARARGLILPSLGFEGMPLVYIEALAAGLPVVAFEPNAAAGLVRRDGTGIATTWEEPLDATLAAAAADFPALRRHCQQVFAERYSHRALVPHLAAVYEEAIEARAKRATRHRGHQQNGPAGLGR